MLVGTHDMPLGSVLERFPDDVVRLIAVNVCDARDKIRFVRCVSKELKERLDGRGVWKEFVVVLQSASETLGFVEWWEKVMVGRVGGGEVEEKRQEEKDDEKKEGMVDLQYPVDQLDVDRLGELEVVAQMVLRQGFAEGKMMCFQKMSGLKRLCLEGGATSAIALKSAIFPDTLEEIVVRRYYVAIECAMLTGLKCLTKIVFDECYMAMPLWPWVRPLLYTMPWLECLEVEKCCGGNVLVPRDAEERAIDAQKQPGRLKRLSLRNSIIQCDISDIIGSLKELDIRQTARGDVHYATNVATLPRMECIWAEYIHGLGTMPNLRMVDVDALSLCKGYRPKEVREIHVHCRRPRDVTSLIEWMEDMKSESAFNHVKTFVVYVHSAAIGGGGDHTFEEFSTLANALIQLQKMCINGTIKMQKV